MRAVLLLAVGLASCVNFGPKSPSESVALKPSTPQKLPGGEDFAVMYRVDNDSRCPSNAVCVWAGNATVVFGIRMASCPTCLPAQQFVNTLTDPRSITVAGYRFTLDSLSPAPLAGQPIDQKDYTAFLTVTRLPE